MKLLSDGEVPAPPAVDSFQETAWTALVVGLVLLASAAALVVWPLAETGWRISWPVALLGLPALIVLLIGRFALRSFLASRRPESWRLRWDKEGLYLRYRSYLNNRFPTDTPAAVYLPRREVGWLRARREALDTPGEHGQWGLKRAHRWLEIGLRHIDPEPLAAALAAEAKLRGPSGWRANDFPLVVSREGTLRLRLRHPDAVLEALRRILPVTLPEESCSGDFEAMSHADKESHIQALASQGTAWPPSRRRGSSTASASRTQRSWWTTYRADEAPVQSFFPVKSVSRAAPRGGPRSAGRPGPRRARSNSPTLRGILR